MTLSAPTAPAAPAAPAAQAPSQSTAPAMPSGPAPGQAPAQAPAGGELPPNFKTVGDLVNAYKALEQKLGTTAPAPGVGAPPPAPPPAVSYTDAGALPPPPPAHPNGDWKAAMAPYAATWAEKGTLSAEQYAELARMGQPRELVDTFFHGQAAIVRERVSTAQNRVGGPEAMKQMLIWAASNLSEGERAQYEAARTSADDARYNLIVDAINARWRAATGSVPGNVFVGSGVSGTGPAPYPNVDAYYKDIAKPEYNQDPAFRQACDARALASPFIAGFVRRAVNEG